MDGDGTSGARTQARMMAFMGVELKPAILKATLRSIAKDEKCEKARPQNSGVNRIPAKSLNVNAVRVPIAPVSPQKLRRRQAQALLSRTVAVVAAPAVVTIAARAPSSAGGSAARRPGDAAHSRRDTRRRRQRCGSAAHSTLGSTLKAGRGNARLAARSRRRL